MKKKKVVEETKEVKAEVKTKEQEIAYYNDVNEIVKGYLKTLLGLEEIEDFVIIATGKDKEKRTVWNWRLCGAIERIFYAMERLKIMSIAGQLAPPVKIVSQSNLTVEDTNKKE